MKRYLKRVVWPAVYITAIIMGIGFLFMGGLTVALIATGDKSLISPLSLIPITGMVGALLLFTLCLLGGHAVYRHSNGTDWFKLKYLLPISFSSKKGLVLLVGFLTLAVTTSAIAAPVPFAGVAGITAMERAELKKVQEQNLLRWQLQLRQNSCLACHYNRNGPSPLPHN